ncbi:host attachment protein [Pseudomonadota bacterium]
MAAAWVVVADTTRARILSADKPASELVEIQTLAHPEARLHEGDITSDKPGRDRNGATTGSHDVGHTTDAKQEEAIRFAGKVSDTIEAGRSAGKFKKLYVIAAPAFLGILRKGHSSSTRQIIAGEVDKNLATKTLADIRKQLPEYL